ncbi:major facilitator superfamily domain-containing protein [Ditylenchus destructor]|uniref:Major facilitator superfamily domain-containing protein n=1 Tax=Ditylenchus destructor TaxID=166010 RepID=A0AAD4NBM6_9BILA|nr:major facilitator superfamily domain-containing protein [Ditylenchus destructor]
MSSRHPVAPSVAVRSDISMSVASRDNNVTPSQQASETKCWKSFRQLLPSNNKINAEPAILLSSISFGVFISVSPLFTLWARCVEIFGKELELTSNATRFCSEIMVLNNTSYLDRVERDIADTTVYIQLCSTLLTLISAPMVGAWSDFHGRRKPFILCCFSITIYSLIQIVAVMTYEKVNLYYFLFLAECINGLFGGLFMLITISSTIVTDDSRIELSRSGSGIPLRIAIASAFQFIGLTLGTLLFSVFSVPVALTSEEHVRGYFRSYVVAAACAILTLVYVIFFVRETHRPVTGQSQVNVSSSYSFLTKVRYYIIESVSVIRIRRPGWTRLCFNLSILYMFLDFTTMDNQLTLLVLKRHPLSWSDELFDKYLVIKGIILSVGTILTSLMLRFFNCVGKESILLLTSIAAAAFMFLILAIAKSTELIFLGLIFALFTGGFSPSLKTILSRMVSKEETGRLFAMVSLVIVLCPLATKLFYYKIYELTLDTWPGFVFLLMAMIHVIVFVGQILVHLLMYPLWASENSPMSTAETSEQRSNVSDGTNSMEAVASNSDEWQHLVDDD